MKFSEAMDLLKSGSKVTREPWVGVVYFLMVEADVKAYQPKLTHYAYNEDIMVSDGWIVEGQEESYKFADIIPFLQKGLKAKLKDWVEMFIFLDRTTRLLAIQSVENFPFTPDFESFMAEDWLELK